MRSSCCCFVVVLLNVLQQTSQKTLSQIQPTQYDRLRRTAGEPIVFPDAKPSASLTSDRNKVVPSLQEPSCPNNEPFCENLDNYPMDLIQDLLKKQPKILLDQFYTDQIPVPDIIDKFAPEKGEPLCNSHEELSFPTVGVSTKGSYEYIINDGDKFKQGVKIERCLSKGECNIPGELRNGYTSHCVQKTIKRMLVILNRNASEVAGLVTEPIEFPSCCSCEVSSVSDRFGFGVHDNDLSTKSGNKLDTKNVTTPLKTTPKPTSKPSTPKPTSTKPTISKTTTTKPTSVSPTPTHATSSETKKS